VRLFFKQEEVVQITNILWFKGISKDNIPQVGGKGANLGEMYNSGFPIPPGFCVTAQAYEDFITTTGIKDQIYRLLENLNVEDTVALRETSKKIGEIILQTPVPGRIKEDIIEAYENMNIDEEIFKSGNAQALDIIKRTGREPPFVAVRSSATAEDLPEASFAGQQATFLNIKGANALIKSVQKCWASLFTARAIYYRVKNNFPHEKVLIAVVVQKMVNSDKSGVIFSINPVTNNESEIMIEAGFGLGEAVVSGAINPDQYIIDKGTEHIKSKKVSRQEWEFVRDPTFGKTVKRKIEGDRQEGQVLDEFEIVQLAKYAKKIEEHYNKPQDIEFAIEGKNIYIVQSRPITTLKKVAQEIQHESAEEAELGKEHLDVLVKGIGASPGVGSGEVKIVTGLGDLEKVQEGNVLVAEMTNPDYVPAMKRAAAIVTDQGGSTSHAAIVSREMGIPCIVGTETATKTLHDGQKVVVDANTGIVYEGELSEKEMRAAEEPKEEEGAVSPVETVTEIKVIMDLPDYAEKAAKTGADGVGLLRGEFINLGSKVHPVYLIKTGRKEEFVNNLYNNLVKIAKPFEGKPVWYRTLDAPTDEFRELEGGENEPVEDNPMMGWRSIRRSLDEPELLKAEYEAVKRAHDAGYTNIGIMIPLVTHVEQIAKAKELLREVGLEPQENIDFGIMVETPAAVQIIEEICQEGVDFISFGTNDLTQFTLAVDRNSAKVQKWYDEMHPAVLRQIKYVIDVCKRHNVETSICGQAGSKPEMAEFLVKAGIDSISANPDAVQKIRHIVARAEKKLLLNVARKDLEL